MTPPKPSRRTPLGGLLAGLFGGLFLKKALPATPVQLPLPAPAVAHLSPFPTDAGQVTTLVYDCRGWLMTLINPLAPVATFTWDSRMKPS